MNILFLTMSKMLSVENRGIYTDLMRKFREERHKVFIVTPSERREGRKTCVIEEKGVKILSVRTLNVQKTNVIEKGIGQVSIEFLYKRAIKKYFAGVSFDLILYSTPPITFPKVIEYAKKVNPSAKTYLLLKDIFPQNAVDLGMFSKNSLFYAYFRRKEIAMYKVSDYIGCMSPANVKFVLEHNDFIPTERVEVAPNSLELVSNALSSNDKAIREKYNLPTDKPLFIYGGNLGKPQGIDFLIQCLNANSLRRDCHFVVVGNGTEYKKIETWYQTTHPQSVSLFARLPKEDYDLLVQVCDVGLIFLDHRFTIPNYPSRLLSYLEYKMPIIAATDVNTDIGRLAEDNGYGYWCESVDVEAFTTCVSKYTENPASIKEMGENGYKFLLDNYLVEHTYATIVKHFA